MRYSAAVGGARLAGLRLHAFVLFAMLASFWTPGLAFAVTPTTTTVVSSVDPAYGGQAVTYTATVASASGTPTGTITFVQNCNTCGGGLSLGTVALVAGQASVSGTIPRRYNGNYTYTIKAIYSGDDGNQASSGEQTQEIPRSPVTGVLTSSLNPSVLGQSVTFTTTYTAESGAVLDDFGVVFYDGDTVISTSGINSSGVATLTTGSLGAGPHFIKAIYNQYGSADYEAGTTNTLTQFVDLGLQETTTDLAISPRSQTHKSEIEISLFAAL